MTELLPRTRNHLKNSPIAIFSISSFTLFSPFREKLLRKYRKLLFHISNFVLFGREGCLYFLTSFGSSIFSDTFENWRYWARGWLFHGGTYAGRNCCTRPPTMTSNYPYTGISCLASSTFFWSSSFFSPSAVDLT
jgi:hypothetical protein